MSDRVFRVAAVVLALELIFASLARPCTASESSLANAAFAQHLADLTNKIPTAFTIVVQPPFIVLGDEVPEMVHQRATRTVKWAVDKLKQDFFQRDPQEIIDIWLFRDAASYTNHTRLLFQETPTSRFGYYSAKDHALIMNIGTGGGTLVHEIVHPFIRANFPSCPAWFDEGFASLFEASEEKDGHIRGLINWRFKGLEKDIKEGKTIPFKQLTSMSPAEFYGGTNYSQHYAQARYLCYYLQEKDLLVKFYHQFVANAQRDPTGFETLKRVLGEKDMDAFKKKWERFILALRGS